MTTRESVTGFDIEIDGRVYPIFRDVCHEHPDEVHKAIGTTSESELQAYLDQLHYDDWFDGDDYKGRDCDGVGLQA